MEVKQVSGDQLIIVDKLSDKGLRVCIVSIAGADMIFLAIGTIHYRMPVLLSITIPTLIGISFLLSSLHAYKVIIDKRAGGIEMFRDNEQIYTSDYPLTSITRIKTVIDGRSRTAFWHIDLIVVLETGLEKRIYKYSPSYLMTRAPFGMDVVANKYAKMGRIIAEFLGVPFTDSELLAPGS